MGILGSNSVNSLITDIKFLVSNSFFETKKSVGKHKMYKSVLDIALVSSVEYLRLFLFFLRYFLIWGSSKWLICFDNLHF